LREPELFHNTRGSRHNVVYRPIAGIPREQFPRSIPTDMPDILAKMSRRCYEETASVEFKLIYQRSRLRIDCIFLTFDAIYCTFISGCKRRIFCAKSDKIRVRVIVKATFRLLYDRASVSLGSGEVETCWTSNASQRSQPRYTANHRRALS